MDNRALLSGMAIGAALTLAFDPDRGARRRALLRDKVVRGSRRTADAADATLRDVQNRARGIAAATRGRLHGEEVDDARLLERVRAKLGRVCSHPHAIDVETRDGEVTLRGPILAEEVKGVMAMTGSVRGVETVINDLEPHDTSEGVPSLQGSGRRAGPSLDLFQSNWAPATRALVSVAALTAGGLAMAYARR
jgi:hypothetical protein